MIGGGRRIVATVVTQLATVVLGAITGMVIARELHAEGRGAFSVVVAIATTALAMGHLSVEQSHTALWRRKRAAIPANSALLGPAAGTLAAVGAFIIVLALGPRAVPLPGYGLLLAALLAVPFGMTVLYLNNVLVLQGRVGVVNRAALLSAVGQCGVLLAFGLAGRLTVPVVVWVWTISMALPLAVVIPAVRPRLRDADWAAARGALKHGLRHHLAFSALHLLLRLDVLVLNGLSSAAAVGVYTVAVTVGELAWIVTNATAQVALSQQADAELADSAAVTLAAARLSTALSAVTVLGMCVTGPVVIPLMYGSGFQDSVPALLALAPGILAFGATRVIGVYLVRLDRPMIISGVTVAAMAGNVSLCLLLIPRWGVVGCALASSAGYIVLGGAQVAWFLRATRTPARALVPGRAELDAVRRVYRARFARAASGPASEPEAGGPHA